MSDYERTYFFLVILTVVAFVGVLSVASRDDLRRCEASHSRDVCVSTIR